MLFIFFQHLRDRSRDEHWFRGLRMPVESIQNASDLLLNPPKPFIWGQLFGDGTSIVHHLLGIMAQLMRCGNSGIDGIAGGYRRCEGSGSHYAAKGCEQRARKICGKRFCLLPAISLVSPSRWMSSHSQLPVPHLADFNLIHSPPSRDHTDPCVNMGARLILMMMYSGEWLNSTLKTQ